MKKNRIYILKKALVLLMVMAVAIGSPPVTATAATAKKTVNVTKKNKKFKKTIYVGDKLKLKVKNGKKTVSYKKLKFKSANKKIATVSKKGVIKAKKAGKVVISVKLKKSKKKCRLTVTVKKKSAKKKATKKSAKKTTKKKTSKKKASNKKKTSKKTSKAKTTAKKTAKASTTKKATTVKTPAKTTTVKQATGAKTGNTSTGTTTAKPATAAPTPTPTPAPAKKLVKKKMYVTVGNLQTAHSGTIDLLYNVCWADKERTKPASRIVDANRNLIGYTNPADGYLVMRLKDGREFIDAKTVFGDDWDNNSDFSNGSGLNYSQLAKRLSKQINKTVSWKLYLKLEDWFSDPSLETLRKYKTATDYINNEFLNRTSLADDVLAFLSEKAGCTITFSDYRAACSIWADEVDKHKFIWEYICYGDTRMQLSVGYTRSSGYTELYHEPAGYYALGGSWGGWPDLIIDEIEVWAWE